MSHYIYKEKKYLELNGKILPLILYADSSVTDWSRRRHPAHWFIQTLECEPALLVDKALYQQAADKKVQDRIDLLNKYYPNEEHSLDSYNPYGDTYRGNGRIRGMKSFLSARRTIPADEFLSKHRFTVSLQPHDTKQNKDKENKLFFVSSVEELLLMDEWYRQHSKVYPDDVIYIGVTGLPGEN